MDAATIQAKLYAGYAKAAQYTGESFNVFRPQAGQLPLANINFVGALNAAMTVAPGTFNFNRGGLRGNFDWYAIADGSQLEVGDFLVAADRTFFIAAMQPLLPIVATLCNATVSITRPVSSLSTSGGLANAPLSQPGGAPYIGLRNTQAGGETTIISGLPCALKSQSVRAVNQKEGLPSSAPGPARWDFYLSPSAVPYGAVKDRDFITDGLGNRYQVATDYWTPSGYTLEAIREEA